MSAAIDAPEDQGDGDTGGRTAAGFAKGSSPAPASPDLRAALRTARNDEAERSRAIADLRTVELARLEVLLERLGPVLAQVPADVDLFDTALVPGPRPRLFIDMIGFVEMAHDRRVYHFVQDRREGRVTLCASERLDVVADAVTAYIARRLVEREKALASTGEVPLPPRIALPPWLRQAGHVVLEYLGIASLVVLLWVMGHALFQWAVHG